MSIFRFLLDEPQWLLLGWLLLMDLVLLFAMGLDKRRARLERWRIPEARLFLLAALGGALGGCLGMRLFHHKTRHWTFRLGFPLLALAQLGFLLYLFWQNGFSL